jgi:hypothetical protein
VLDLKKMTRILSCKIQSYTHKLVPEAFNFFKKQKTYINISEIGDDHFTLNFDDSLDSTLSEKDFINKSHAVFNIYIVAFNVCSMGLFLPQEQKHLSPEYSFTNTRTGVSGKGLVVQDVFDEDFAGQEITEGQVLDAFWLYGALAKEKNEELIAEYLKGLVHLGLNYPGTHFEKDAFTNFYRIFEHLVTNKLLGKRKLQNELNQMSSVLATLGLSQDLLDEFKKMYILRGSQAMHSQINPMRISRENTLKMKAFTDVVIYKSYKPVWEDQLKI